MQKIFKISLIFLVATLASTTIFWVLRVPSGNMVAGFQFVVIIAFAATLLGLSAKLSIHISKPNEIICIVFLATSTFLLINVVLQLHSVITVGLSFFACSLLPGYSILRLTRISPPESYVETAVLSYVLSLPITAVIGTIIFLYIGEGFRELAFALTYLLMSLLLLLHTSRSHGFKIHRDENAFEITDPLFWTVIGGVFLVFISGFYPLMAYLPSNDIARHFGSVQQIIRVPELLSSVYPWFDFYEAVFFVLSKPSLEIFQTSLALSSFIMILTFYAMASIHLRKIDQRLPIIATVFWFMFGGFGWLWLLRENVHVNMSFFDLLRLANDASYIDISNPRVWFWFVPMIPGFTLLFALLYLLKRHDISTIHFRFIYSILIAALALFHIPELVILVVVLTVLSFFVPKLDLRLKDAVLSSVIGLPAALLISFSLYYNTRVMASIPWNVLLGLILPLVLAHFSLKFNWKGIDIFSKLVKLVIYATLTVYVAGTMSWLANPSFSVSMVHETLFVPWLLYPVRLGLIGLFALIGALVMTRHNKSEGILFVCMFFSTIVFARILSYVNIYLFKIGFYEQRFIQSSLLPATSILAAFGMKPLITKFSSFKHLKVRRILIIILTCSLIVIIGTTSTLLAYDYRNEASRRTIIGEKELSSVSFLTKALYDNPRSPVLTLTARSMTEVGWSGPIFIVNPLHLPAWSSINPEIPLLVLFRGDPQFTAPYIYLHERDKNAITKGFPDSLLLREVVPMLPAIYQNDKVELYKIPEGSPPLVNSSTALLVPLDYQDEVRTILPVFLSLSLGGYEYTTMLDSDSSALEKNVIIVPIDTKLVVVEQLLTSEKSNSTKKLIVFNSMGYGPISEYLFFEEKPANEVKGNLIEGVEKLLLPFDVNVPLIKARENVEILGWFSGENEKVPFVGRKVVNKIEVVYVNIYPLISEITTHSANDAAALLGVMLNTVELGLAKFSTADFKLEDLLFFRDANFEGEITVRASSVVFPSNEKIQLRLEGEHEIYSVCSILLTGVNSITIRTDCGQVGEGIGFYTKLMLGNSTFKLNGKEIRMEAELENNEVIRLNRSSMIKFHTQEWTSIYARTPTLSITGNTTFKEAYGLHNICKQFRASGQTLRSNDSFNFTVLASDVYTIAADLFWRGPVQRDTPVLQWDELESLRESIPWFALSIIIVLMSHKIIEFWHKRPKKRCKSERRSITDGSK